MFLRQPAPPIVRPSRTLFVWLIGSFLLTLVPHFQQMPSWLTLLALLAIAARCLIEWRRAPLPSVFSTGAVALCLVAAIYLQFRTVFGRDAGIPLMAGLLTIKFFELRGPRDIALIIFSSFFVIMSALLYSQSLELFLYCLTTMWILTAVLLRVHTGDYPEERIVPLLGRSGLIFIQALPLALILFFFLPRYSGKLQLGLNDASIGLTNHMEPGTVSRLTDDLSTAMSVRFTNGTPPGLDSMYWRAFVLWDFAKGVWTPGPAANEAQPGPPQPARDGHDTVEQEITLFPDNESWLFALDHPVSLPVDTQGRTNWAGYIRGDSLALGAAGGRGAGIQLDHKIRYTVVSAPELAPENLSPGARLLGTRLPRREIDPRVQALADELHRHARTTDEYIVAVLHYFRQQKFTYTYSPGPQGADALANFLFVSHAGFCEHFSSAFAVLMRLEGIPARVVVGYQGAQYNPYRNIYIVKQDDAHAWDEVWSDERKTWERVDPTRAVTAGDAAVGQGAGPREPGEDLSVDFAHQRFTLLSADSMPGWLRRGLLEIELRRQQLESDWDDWIFSYDPATQNHLVDAFGDRRGPWIMAGACLLGVAVSALVFWIAIRRADARSPLDRAYDDFCAEMARRGAPRETWEGPLDYTRRLARDFPQRGAVMAEIGDLVSRARYAPPDQAPADPAKELRLLTRAGTASISRGS
jgi:transglutaminase-like putative cysteine protease